MNKRIVTILLIAFVFVLNACQKSLDEDYFVPDPGQSIGPDTTWYSAITDVMPIASLRNSLLLDTYSDSIDVGSSNDTVTTASGLQCIFPANSCVNAAGQPVTGKIKAEFSLLKSNGDIIRMNKPTTSNNRILVSAGEIYVGLKKENAEVFLAPAKKIEVKFAATLPSTLMNFFSAAVTQNTNAAFNWLENTDLINNNVSIGAQAYEIHTNKLKWINCAYFFDTVAVNRSILNIQLPSSYTNANTSVYVVFKDMRSVVALTADITSKKFVSGKLPDGKLATIVVISKQGNDFFFGRELISTGVSSVTLTPVKTSLADIKTSLNSL